jgi:hypothetical protein
MGWSFRKSTSFGPFRLNFSRSGLGLSLGVKGARISVNNHGTYVNLGTNGIHYRQRIDGKNASPRNEVISTTPVESVYSGVRHTITTDSMENVTDVDSQEFVKELESKASKISFFKFFGLWPSLAMMLYAIIHFNQIVKVETRHKYIFTINKRSVHVRSLPTKDSHSVHMATQLEKYDLAAAYDSTGWIKIRLAENSDKEGFVRADMGSISRELLSRREIKRSEDQPLLWVAFLFLALLLSAWCVYLYRLDKKRKKLEIYYTLDKETGALHEKFLEFFREFSSSKRIWQKLHVKGVGDGKYFAGASELVTRIGIAGIALHRLPSQFLKTNISVPFIALRNTEMYFFPERIILKRGNKFGAVFYKNIRVSSDNVNFIEEEAVPADASVVSQTWKYLNKSGGPDRRFTNNRMIPVCLYTDYKFESDSGMEEVITTSKAGGMDNFVKFLGMIGEYQRGLN